MNRVVYAGAIWTGNVKNKSFLIVGGCRVSYAHVVYSPEGIAPTVCSAHFQPLILEDEKDIDKH